MGRRAAKMPVVADAGAHTLSAESKAIADRRLAALAQQLGARPVVSMCGARHHGELNVRVVFVFIHASTYQCEASRTALSCSIDAFGAAIFGAPTPVAIRRALARADGLTRKTIFEAARSGLGLDQRWLVENCLVPLAVVNGSQDPFINLDYCEVPKYANLWKGRCYRLPGLQVSQKIHRRCRAR